MRTDRPLFVLINDPAAEASLPKTRREALLRKRTRDDDLYVALQWFKPVQLELSQLSAEERKSHTRGGVGWLVLAPNGEVLMSRRGDTSSKGLVKMADKAWKAFARENLGKKRRRLASLLDDIQKAEDEVATLGKRIEELQAQLDRRDNPSTAQAMKKTEKLLTEAQTSFDELVGKRDVLVAAPSARGTIGAR